MAVIPRAEMGSTHWCGTTHRLCGLLSRRYLNLSEVSSEVSDMIMTQVTNGTYGTTAFGDCKHHTKRHS